jgi:hypothetical protein
VVVTTDTDVDDANDDDDEFGLRPDSNFHVEIMRQEVGPVAGAGLRIFSKIFAKNLEKFGYCDSNF